MASVLPRRTKFILDEDRIPRAWYNIAADLPAPPPPPLHPGTRQPIGPADLAPLFPMALIRQEVSTEREIEIPDPVREAYALYRPVAAVPRPPARAGARYAGPHLLQVRGRQPGRQPQAEHRASPRRSTTSRRASTRLATETGAGPVGQRAGLRRRRVRPRGQGLHGPGELRPEAVPPDPDGDLRRAGRAPAPASTRTTAARCSAQTPGLAGLAGHGDQRGGRGRRDPRRHEVLARLGAQPRAAAPDGHRPGGASSRWRWPARSPT